jgi:Mn2+/Fe2+ NRAMP family transporter
MIKISLWRKLGPGILLAATSIGASHLALSPQAGALFGFQLLWLVLVCHLFKYPAFEFGPRYAAATGQSLLAGYAQAPGPRMWALYMFLLSTVLQGVGVLAGVVNISGCVLASWFGKADAATILTLNATELSSILVLLVIFLLLFVGGFSWLDHLNKIMMLILLAATVLAFAPVVPNPKHLGHLIVPSIPSNSIVLIAAILGWMPTGIDVSIWHSFWTLEKLKQLGGEHGANDLRKRLRQLKLSLTDMRVGYGLSLVTAIIFLSLGAIHLAGRGSELSGVQFAEAISSAYTVILGRWMRHVFMLTAFFAMFSTSYVVIDGFARAFCETLALLSHSLSSAAKRKQVYASFVTFTGLCAAGTIIWVGNPVTLVTIVSLISLAVAPALYALNLYCVQAHIKDAALRPSKYVVMLGWAGIVFMLATLMLTIYTKM